MTTKEQLIEKYQKNYKEMRLEIPTGEIISDLQSLQDTTEDKPTVATVLAYEQGYKEALSKVASILKKEKCIGVPYRNGIERGIEVAEELLANSV